MRLAPLALTLAVSVGLVSPVSAQDQLETVSGQTYEGKVLSDDGNSVKFQTEEGMTLTLPHKNLTPLSQYMLRRANVGSDAASQQALAEWCVKHALYKEAQRHYQLALAADPGKSKQINASIAQARTDAGNELLQRAKTLQQRNRPEDARQVLSTIVQELPGEPAATEASTMLAADTAKRKSSALQRAAPATKNDTPANGVPTRQNGEAFSAEAQKTFAPVVKLYHSILDNTQKGLSESNQSRSIKAFQQGLADGDKARQMLQQMRSSGSENSESTEATSLLNSKIESATVNCTIQLANAYMLRTSYNQAADVVKASMAVYPQNTQLNQTMDRVTSASSSDNVGGGWVIRRGNIPRAR
ncbi:MAG: hypothetical protein P8N09_13770 [Planctomycetota bacterium]|nr:hypothetical protein [Planctomycetota bacterium]